MPSVGDRIKYARQNRNLTQGGLAILVGTTKGAISRYENNLRVPNLDQLQSIANALGVPVGKLLGAAPALIPDEFNAFESIIERAGFYLRYVEDEGRYALHKGSESVPLSVEEMKALVRTSERHVITAVEDFMDNKKTPPQPE